MSGYLTVGDIGQEYPSTYAELNAQLAKQTVKAPTPAAATPAGADWGGAIAALARAAAETYKASQMPGSWEAMYNAQVKAKLDAAQAAQAQKQAQQASMFGGGSAMSAIAPLAIGAVVVFLLVKFMKR